MQSYEEKKPFINAEVWQSLVTLEANGNSGILKEIIGLYVSSAPQVIEALKLASKKGDFKSLHETAHSFKSSCQSVGALDLGDQLDKIEAAAKKAAPTVDVQFLEEVLANIRLVAIELGSRCS